MKYFDYESIAREAGIEENKLRQLASFFSAEEPNDPMLAELHTLRACMAIKNGRLSLNDALKDAGKLAADIRNN